MAHGIVRLKQPKKAKQVTGNVTKLKKLGELKKVKKEIAEVIKKEDKLFTKQRKLQEQLGIA